MRCPYSMIASFVLLASSGMAAAKHVPGAAARSHGQADPARVGAHLKQSAAEVKRLQQDVTRQESRSRQAAERLREQDRALEQLRRQLQATRGAAVSQNEGS